MKSLLKIPYYLLVLGVASIGLLLVATMVPIPGNFKAKIVKSGSMEPAIRTGGLVLMRPSATYEVGDVITFGPDTKTQIPTTHRIIEVAGRGSGRVFTTKGDANDAPDPVGVKLSDIEGKVFFSVPYVGYILDFARKPVGFFLLVGIPALLIIFDEIFKIIKEVKRMRTEKRRGKDGDRNNGGGEARRDTINGINVRPRVIDLRMRPAVAMANTMANVPRSHYPLRTLAIFLVIFGPIIGISSFGSTIAFYNENEYSLGNILRAGTDYGDNPVLEVPVPEIAAALVLDIDSEVASSTASTTILTTETAPEEVASSTEPVIVEDVSGQQGSDEELPVEIIKNNMDDEMIKDEETVEENEGEMEETTEEGQPKPKPPVEGEVEGDMASE